jgi:hypothetical protein
MRPPYHPEHVEAVDFAQRRDRRGRPRQDPRRVVARCSCGVDGPPRELASGDTARLLADDFNAHRATYVQAVPA